MEKSYEPGQIESKWYAEWEAKGLFAPAASGDQVGLAVRCPACGKVSVNLVSRAHVDVPFVNDREVGVVQHHFHDDAAATVAEFQAELWSGSFDARRPRLE